jgi:hypothetical protein
MSVESLRQRIADFLAAHDPKAMEPIEFPDLYLKKAKADQLAFDAAGAHRARLAVLVDLPRAGA